MTRPNRRTTLGALILIVIATSASSPLRASAQPPTSVSVQHVVERQQQSSIDWNAVAQALGKSGQLMPGDVYRVGLPRTDLSVSVEGTPVKAGFALGSYAAFEPLDGGGAMVMGDLVLLDEEVPSVMSGLFAGGLSVTALHNHLNQVSPHVMYLHYSGEGDPVQLASAIHQALSVSGTPFGDTPVSATMTPELDSEQLGAIFGRTMTVNNGVYSVSVPRVETITENGIELPPAMGTATSLNFQALGSGQAAITGDFVLIGGEVNPVAQTLRANSIEVTALHNHALADEPRLFYLHFWATGDALTLARGLQAALDQTNSQAALNQTSSQQSKP